MADQVETNAAEGVSDTSGTDQNLQTLHALHLDGKGAPSLDEADERSLGNSGDTRPDDVTGNANVVSAGRSTFEQMVQGGIREQAAVPTSDNIALDTVQPSFRDHSVTAQFENVQPAFAPPPATDVPEARPQPENQNSPSPDLLVTRDPQQPVQAAPNGDTAPVAPAAAPVAPVTPEAAPVVQTAEDPVQPTPPTDPIIPKVADAPRVTLAAASGTEDSDTKLNITVATADLDGGNERISAISINNVPAGFSFVDSSGRPVGTSSGGGSWSFTQDQLNNLYLRQPHNYSGDLALTVSATSSEASGGSATTTQTLNVHVEAVADAPGLVTHNAAGMEDALIPLSISVTSNDTGNEGSGAYAAETQNVYIDRLPNGATLVDGTTGQALTQRLDSALVIGGTTIPAGSYVVTSAQLANLKVQSAANDSHDFQLDVWATSTEPSNGSVAVTGFQTVNVDVGIVAPTVFGSGSGLEGQWSTLSLSGTVNHDLAGDQETLTVYIENLPPGAQIRFADGTSPTATVVNGVTRYDVTGHLSDTQVRWTDGRSDADMDLTVRGVVHDTDVGTSRETALGDATAPDWNQSTANVHVTVQAVADGPSGLSASGIGVEDKWFDLNVTTGLIDTDGSEKLTVEVTGPAGFLLADKTDTTHPYTGTLSADGSTVTYTLTQAQLSGLQMRAKGDSDTDIDLTIKATATETASGNGQIATASSSLTIPLNVKILSDADKPIVSVVKDTQTINEDALFDLSKSVGGSFSDGTTNHAAVSGGSAEAGSTLGASTSQDGSETITYRITANQDSRISLDGGATSRAFANGESITVSAADIASGKVQLGGPSDWASSTAHPNLTFKVVTIATEATNDAALATNAALARETVRESDPATLTIAVNPVADVATARLSVVASGYEDGLSGTANHAAGASGSGIAVTPTLVLTDADHSESPTGLVTLTSSDPAMTGGTVEYNGVTIHPVTDGSGKTTWTITGASFSTTDHSSFTLAGLVFHPAANSDADPKYDLAVQFQDTNGSTTATVTVQDQTIIVQAVADAPTLSTAAAGGWESASGTSDIALSINAALTDTDGSETLYVYVTGIPQGAATLSAYTSVSTADVTIGGVTIAGSAANPVYKLTADQLTNLKLQVAQGYSEDMQLKVYAESVETRGGDIAVTGPATLNVDIGVLAPSITGTNAVSGAEDSYIQLSDLATNRAAPDATDSMSVYVENLPAGATLYKMVGGSYVALGTTTYKDASGVSHTGYDVTSLRGANGELSGVYVKWDAANKATDIDFTLRSVVADNDADSTADAGGVDRNTPYGQTYNDITEKVESVHVTVVANADAPILTASAIGVEDKGVALTINPALVDTDGSETLTVTVSGVPSGVVLSAGTLGTTAADGTTTWTFGPVNSTSAMQSLLNNLRMTGLPANSDADFNITVRATATETETGAQVGTATAYSEQVVNVKVLSDADKPVVSVVKETQTINEDGLFSLAQSVTGTFSDGATGTHAAATGTAGEAGSVQGATTSQDGSETVTYRITADQDSRISLDGGLTTQSFAKGATIEVSAADLVSGKVRVGGIADWASSTAAPNLTFKIVAVSTETRGGTDDALASGLPADLTRSSVAVSDPATLTIAVNPVADLATASLTVTASGYEDGLANGSNHTSGASGSGIAVTPTLTLTDADHSERPTGLVTITSSDGNMIAGSLEYNGTTIVPTHDSAGTYTWTIPAGTFATSNNSAFTLTGLVFHPQANNAADPKFNLAVQFQDTDSSVLATKTITNQTITVQAVADTPSIATHDTATWESASGVKTIALDITATASADTDGSESLYVLVTDLPSGAGSIIGTHVTTYTSGTVSGLTATAANPVYRIPAADLASLRLQLNQGYSSDLALKVYSQTVEAENNDTALSAPSTLKVDIGVLDPVISGPSSLSGTEDNAVSLSSVNVTTTAADGSETRTVYVETPSGVTLYDSNNNALTRVTFTDAAGVSHSGYNVTGNLTASGGLNVSAKNSAANSDADFTLKVYAVVKDADAGTARDTAYDQTYHDTAQATATVQVTVSAVADQPGAFNVVAVGVEDKWIAVNLTNVALVDTDGSETLSVTISGVPTGMVLESAGTIPLVQVDANTWKIGPAATTAEMKHWLEDSDLRITGLATVKEDQHFNFPLTVTATATENGTDGQVATATASRSTTLSVTVFADADTPVVDVLKGATIPAAETVGEDALYNLKDAIKAYSGEDADDYVGHIADAYGWQSKDGSETLSFKITVPNACTIKVGATTYTLAAGGELTVSAKDIVDGNVSVGGVANWASSNSNDVLRFDLTPVATEGDKNADTSAIAASNALTDTDLSRSATASGETKSFYLHVTPEADTTDIVVSASGLEDSAGIPIAPAITLHDADGSEVLSGFVEIMVKSDGSGAFPGSITYSGSGMVDAGVETYEGVTYHVFKVPVGQLAHSGATYTLNGLNFVPTAESDLDIQYRIRATTAEAGNSSTYATVSSLSTLTVAAVADAPVLTIGAPGATTDGAGVVTLHDSEDGRSDGIVRLDLGAALKDTDGSEVLSNVELRAVPTGWGVVTVDAAGNKVALVGSDPDGDGKFTFVLDPVLFKAGSGLTVALVPPANSDVDVAGIQFWAKTTETAAAAAGRTATDNQINTATAEKTLTFNVQLDPVADQPTLMVTNARTDEDNSVALDIRAVVTDPDETATVTVTGVPNGGVLSYTGADGLTHTVTFGNGVTSLTCTAEEARSLRFTPPKDASGKYTLTVTATSTDTDPEGLAAASTATRTATLDVSVKGVNDDILDAAGHAVNAASGNLTATGTEDANGNLVSLGLGDYRINDVDGSETLSAVIQGLPAGVTLVVKTEAGIQDLSSTLQYIGKDAGGDPIWSVPSAYLKYVYVQVPHNYSGSFNLSVRLVETEADGAAAAYDKTLTVTVRPDVDSPNGWISGSYVEDHYGADGGLAFGLNASVSDGNLNLSALGDGGVEHITALSASVNVDAIVARNGGTTGIHVTGPNGTDYGVELVDGHYVIRLTGLPVSEGTSVSLSGFTLYGVPKDWSRDVPVSLSVTVKDGAETATFTKSGSIVLTPEADAPTLAFASSDPNHVYTAGGDGQTITIIADNGITTTDSDGSESFYVVVSGVPNGVVVKGGLNNGDGSWTLPSGQSKVVLVDHTGAGTSTLTIKTVVTDRDQDGSGSDTKTFTNVVTVDYGSGTGGGGGTELTMSAAVAGSLTTTEDSSLNLSSLGITVSDASGATFAVAADGTVTGTSSSGAALGEVGTVSLVVQVPSGWSLSGSGIYLLSDVNGVQTYNVPYSLRGGVSLTPPKDYAGTGISLDVRAVVTDNHGHYSLAGDGSGIAHLPITVTPETDGATISASVGTAVEDAAAIPITLTVSDKETQFFSETLADGTITVTVNTVDGHLPGTLQTGTLPSGAVVAAGATPGTYTITLTQAQMDAFANGANHGFTLAGLNFVPDANFSGSVSIAFTAQVQDSGTDVESSTSTVSFNVTPVIDQTTYSVGTMAGNEDQAIALNLTISHQDLAGTGNWGSETASVVISGVPAGAIIAGATNNGPTTVNGVTTYSWTVDRSHLTITAQGITLNGVTYTSPRDDSSDPQLTFTTYVFEKGVAEPASTSVTCTVTVNGITDGATLNPNNASGDEDQVVAINLGLQKLDASEETYVTVSGVPDGCTFQNGAGGAVGSAGALNATTGTRTWTFSVAEVAALGLATGGALYVVGPTHVSGSWTLTAQAFTLDTDGSVATQVASNPLPLTLTLAAVANAPSLTTDSAIRFDEDGQHSLNLRAGLEDVDGSESLSVTITGAPAGSIIRVNTGTDDNPVWQDIHGQNGTWTISAGTALTLEKVYVQPPANYNGSFDLNVVASSTEKTGGSADSVTKVISVTVDAVNDAPVLSVVSGGIGIESGNHTDPITLLKAADSLTVTDVDSALLSGLNVSISGGSGLSAADSLSLTGLNVTLAEDGSLVTTLSGGAVIGISYDPATHTLSFSGTATPAQYADLARHVVFTSSTGTLSAGTREVTFTAFDDGGLASTGSSTGITVTVTGTATVAGAAAGELAFSGSGTLVLPAATIAAAEDAAPIALGLDMAGMADPDLHVTITGMPVGTVFRDAAGNAVSLDTLTAGQLSGLRVDLPDNWNGTATLTVSTTAGATVLSEQVTLNVAAVNDAPTTSPVTLAGTNEDTAFTFTTAQLLTNAADVDDATATLTVSNLSAAHGAITDNGDGTFTYTPAANYHGPDSITYTIADPHNASVGGSATFAVTSVNDAPTVAADHTAQTATISGGVVSSPLHVVQSDAAVNIADVDGTTLSGMTVQLLPDSSGHYAVGDTLGLYGHDIALNSSCQLVVQGTDIQVSYDANSHTLSFNGDGSTATYTDLMKSVVLSNTTSTLSTGQRSFGITLYDDAHGGSLPLKTTLDVSDGAATSVTLDSQAHGAVYWNGGTPVLNGTEGDNSMQVQVGIDWSVNGNGGSDTLMLDGIQGDWTFAVSATDHLVHVTSASHPSLDGIIHMNQGSTLQPFADGTDQVVFNGSANGSIDFNDGHHVAFANLEKIHG